MENPYNILYSGDINEFEVTDFSEPDASWQYLLPDGSQIQVDAYQIVYNGELMTVGVISGEDMYGEPLTFGENDFDGIVVYFPSGTYEDPAWAMSAFHGELDKACEGCDSLAEISEKIEAQVVEYEDKASSNTLDEEADDTKDKGEMTTEEEGPIYALGNLND